MDQLLDVMTIDEHKLKLKKTLLNINNVIKECITELSYLIKEKEHELKGELKEEILLKGDREDFSKLFLIFFLILSNLHLIRGKLKLNLI